MSIRQTSIVVLVALLIALACSLSAEAQSSNAKGSTFTGIVDVTTVDDFESGVHKTFREIKDFSTGKKMKIRFEKEPKQEMMTGDIVSVTGVDQGGELVVPAGEETNVSVLVTGDSASLTERRVVVLVVNFLDTAVASTVDQVSDIMFTDPSLATPNASVDGYYRESSFGQLGLYNDVDGDGYSDVFGPFSVNYSSTGSCDYYAWAAAAEDEATLAGVDLSLYQHIVFVMPANSCGWSGVANVGCGTQCRVWVFRSATPDVYAHEFGHNLGMGHASTDTNNDGTVEAEYGDNSDIMGYSNVGWRHQNAAHKEQMNWFASYPSQVVSVTQSGTYRISPLETMPWQAACPQILKVLRADGQGYYYFSYRTLTGYDAPLRTQYAYGCAVHRCRSGASQTSYIDTLLDGETFSDLSNGITLQQISHVSDASGYLDVNITFSAVYTAPTVSVSPSLQISNAGGKPLSYPVQVVNTDGTGSPSSSFTVKAVVPTGWTCSITPSVLTLAPGMTGSATAVVTPPATAASGTYSIRAEATASGHPTGSANCSYQIDSLAPNAVTTLSTSVRRSVVKGTWTAPTDAGGSGVANYEVWRSENGGAFSLVMTVSTASFQETLGSAASYGYMVVAVDKAGNRGPAGNVLTIQNSTTTTKPSRK